MFPPFSSNPFATNPYPGQSVLSSQFHASGAFPIPEIHYEIDAPGRQSHGWQRSSASELLRDVVTLTNEVEYRRGQFNWDPQLPPIARIFKVTVTTRVSGRTTTVTTTREEI